MKTALLCIALVIGAAATGYAADVSAGIALLQQTLARDRQALSHYVWQQDETVTISGTVKKKAVYKVQLGANGRPQRTQVSQSIALPAEYEGYAKQLVDLAGQYAQIDPKRLQELKAAGNLEVRAVGAPGVEQVSIDNYVKKGDAVTLNFNRSEKAILSYVVVSYLNGPSDDIAIAVQCARLADGTTHVSALSVSSESKNLTVMLSNSGYQRR